ncbi:MAG: PEGA domain-containing protein [Patescibacteria group bacterium]|nr:PEGA domain-containing protein [Patescibacteria group bacterium]
MKTGLITCAVLALVLAGCGENGTEPDEHGTIICQTLPDSAAIWLDGIDTGKVTDAELTDIDFGEHVVTFTIHGYHDYAETVTVNASPVMVYRNFPEHKPPALRVLSNPPGAIITLNDTTLSVVTPAVFPDVPLGCNDQCDVYLRLPGYYPHFETVLLDSENTITVSATLEPCPDIDLTFARNDTLYAMKADGLTRRVLATGLGNGGLYQVSPNGQYIAYSAITGIVVANRDGSIRAEMPSLYGGDDYAWSNSGDQLVFGQFVDGIYLYDAPSNTTREILETRGFLYDHSPTFSPGDSYVAYVYYADGNDAAIKVMRADGSEARTVFSRARTKYDASSLRLCWAASNAIIWTNTSGIYRVDPNAGTNEKVVDAYLTSVAYSPDRTKYAFIESGDQHGLYIGTVGQWDRRRLLDTHADAPRWLPGNDCLQYWGDGHLKLMSSDGTTHIIAP